MFVFLLLKKEQFLNPEFNSHQLLRLMHKIESEVKKFKDKSKIYIIFLSSNLRDYLQIQFEGYFEFNG